MQDEFNFDTILAQRTKFGFYQVRQLMIICLVDFLDGAEFLFIQLLAPTLKKEWNISVTELSLYTSLFNLGIMLGTIVCGFLADRLGRKILLVIGSFLQVLIVLGTCVSQNITQMVILRFLYGFVIGINLPISQILMTEVTPPAHRGKIVISLQLAMVLGRMWIFVLAFLFMTSLSEGNWRAMAFCNAIPCFLCFIGSWIWINESPRFLICKGRMEEGIEKLNLIGKINSEEYNEITAQEISLLDEWRQKTFQKSQAKFSELFNSKNLKVTWRNFCISSLFLFVLIGILSIMTFLLDGESKTLWDLFYIELADFLAIFLLVYSIDQVGRINILNISTILNLLLQIAFIYYQQNILVIGFMIFKFLAIIGWSTSCILFAESYNTSHRALGLGVTMAVGRVGGSISPLIIYPIYYANDYYPFYLTSLAFMIMLVVILTYPMDLTQKPLDQIEDQIEED